MLGRVAFIARKDWYYFWLDRESYVWVFIMPIVFMFFIGTVTSQMGGPGPGSGGEGDVVAVVAPADAGFLADQIILRLEENGYKVDQHETAEWAKDYSRRLILPAGFTETALGGEQAVVTLENNGEGLTGDYDRVRVGRAVYTVLADLIVCANEDRSPDPEAFEELAEMPRTVAINVKSAGKRRKIPTGFEQAVPGIMIMFSLIIIVSSTSATLVVERESGLLRRLASAPIARGEVFAGRWIARLGIGYIQLVVGLIAGSLLFAVDWGPNLWMILLVLLAWTAACASLGLLMGNLVRSEGQGIGITVLAANILCAVGGQMWPIEITPAWMQNLAGFLPNRWTMDAIHQLSLFGAEPAAVVPHLAALVLAATVVGGLGMRTFRYQ